MSEGVLTALIVAAGTALNILVALYREGRTRKWAMEDRRLGLEEAKAHAREIAEELAAKTAADKKVVIGKLDNNTAKLDKNTALTEKAVERAEAAYKEANTVNLKIASIGLKAVDDKPLSSHEPEI